jgi:hypothetical protein
MSWIKRDATSDTPMRAWLQDWHRRREEEEDEKGNGGVAAAEAAASTANGTEAGAGACLQPDAKRRKLGDDTSACDTTAKQGSGGGVGVLTGSWVVTGVSASSGAFRYTMDLEEDGPRWVLVGRW